MCVIQSCQLSQFLWKPPDLNLISTVQFGDESSDFPSFVNVVHGVSTSGAKFVKLLCACVTLAEQ